MAHPVYTTNHEYSVVPYSSDWPVWYQNEANLLSEIFGKKALSIEHIGSTAIPGMSAKPQLDILVLMQSTEDTDSFTERLVTEGYIPHGEVLNRGGRLFSRWNGNVKTVNLHIYPPGATMVWQFVATRDYLLSHPQEAQAYAELKLDLYKKYPNNYLKYREHKDPWLDELQERMRQASSCGESLLS